MSIEYQTLILDPGHGGQDPGACAGGAIESLLNARVCHRIQAITNFFIPTILTRVYNDPNETELADRVKQATQYDLFISVHHNAATDTSAKGLEIYHYPGSEPGILLAKYCYDNILHYSEAAGIVRSGRGLKTKDLYVINQTPCPAILIEVGFMTNQLELWQMQQEKTIVTTAYAVAMAVLQFIGKW